MRTWVWVGFTVLSLVFGTIIVTLSVINALSARKSCAVPVGRDPGAGPSSSDAIHSIYGVCCTIAGNVINGFGIGLQKLAHNALGQSGTETYFKSRYWWFGFLLVVVGEGANAVAYGLAPTNVVAPLGGVTIIVTDAIAISCLGERLTKLDVAGGLLILIGVGLLTASTPLDTRLFSADELLSDEIYLSAQSVGWLASIALSLAAIGMTLHHRCASRTIAFYAALAAGVSMFTVLACRGFFSMIALIKSDCDGNICHKGKRSNPCFATVGSWLFWCLGYVIVVTAFFANAYIEQRGLQVFDQKNWVPVHFAFCNVFFVLGGAIVFRDFYGMDATQIALFSSGMAIIMVGCASLLRRTRTTLSSPPESPQVASGAV